MVVVVFVVIIVVVVVVVFAAAAAAAAPFNTDAMHCAFQQQSPVLGIWDARDFDKFCSE